MPRKIVLCLSHSIEEFQQLTLLHSLGHEVFSIGGYINPAHPHDTKRPAAPQVPHYPTLQQAVDLTGGLGPAQERIPDAVFDWADTIIFHHYLDRLYGQWDSRIAPWLKRSSANRVIWRTVGQSVENNERQGAQYRARGMEILRYSPKETSIPSYAGADGLIRFWVDPQEWSGWTGSDTRVLNITQHLKQRDPWTNHRAWLKFTKGLSTRVLGPGSEVIGVPGQVSYQEMQEALRSARCYLYTGTQPASYTLGLIEAMMTGVPVVSIGHHWHNIFGYNKEMFEGPELAVRSELNCDVTQELVRLQNDLGYAQEISAQTRARALELFSKDTVAAQWQQFLSK